MKSKTITTIQPFFFENNLIISLTKKWLEIFEGIPVFTVKIVKDRLILESSKIKKPNHFLTKIVSQNKKSIEVVVV